MRKAIIIILCVALLCLNSYEFRQSRDKIAQLENELNTVSVERNTYREEVQSKEDIIKELQTKVASLEEELESASASEKVSEPEPEVIGEEPEPEVVEEESVEAVEEESVEVVEEEPAELAEVYTEEEATEETATNLVYLGTFEMTAYEWTGNPCANGNYPTVGYTVACNSLPLGTQVYIEGCGYYVVEDRGASWHGDNWMDMYLGDINACYNWGIKYLDVYLVE